eukprot:symbB.v1.2.032717.t1/scaffold3963.1/size47363/1
MLLRGRWRKNPQAMKVTKRRVNWISVSVKATISPCTSVQQLVEEQGHDSGLVACSWRSGCYKPQRMVSCSKISRSSSWVPVLLPYHPSWRPVVVH